jgi:hypothetical protein
LAGEFSVKRLGTFPSLRAARNPIVNLGLILLVVYAAYKTAQIILADDLPELVYAGLLIVGAAVVVAVLNDWRRGLYILVGWILFEDFFRKYLGNNMAIYFAKDVLTLILYISFFRAFRDKTTRSFEIPFRVPLLAFIWLGMLQVFNPASTSIFYGLLGMKVYFLYVPLIFIGYEFIQSEEDLRRFFTFSAILWLAVASLGFAQSIIGPQFLNPSTLQEDIREMGTLYRTAPISGLTSYRPSAIFVSAGRFQNFLLLSWILSLGFGGYLLLRGRRERLLTSTTVGVLAAASLMSGSRGVFLSNIGNALIIVAGFLWGAPWRQGQAMRTLRALQRVALVVGLATILLITIFPKELGSRWAIYMETLSPNSPKSELASRASSYPLANLFLAFGYPRWPYGYGIGTCTFGGQYVVRIMHAQPMGIGVESGFGNLLLELGIVGLFAWIALGFSIVISSWKVVNELRGTPWFPLSFAIWFFGCLLFFPWMYVGASPYQDFLLNSSFWLLLGILYRLRTLPKATQFAQYEAVGWQA